MLDILIPLGFVAFILYLTNQQLHWYKYLEGFLEKAKKVIFKYAK